MPAIEQRDVDEDKLEDLLTTIPLLRTVSSSSSSTDKRQSSVTPGDVTLFVNKPNVHIVRPIPRPIVVKDDTLATLEAQILRGGHDAPTTSSPSNLDMKKYPTVVVPQKKKLIPMDPVMHKPLFITTVPSGVFLEKSPDRIETRKVYNYSSAPRVLQNGETQSFLNKVSATCLSAKKGFYLSSIDHKSHKGIR